MHKRKGKTTMIRQRVYLLKISPNPSQSVHQTARQQRPCLREDTPRGNGSPPQSCECHLETGSATMRFLPDPMMNIEHSADSPDDEEDGMGNPHNRSGDTSARWWEHRGFHQNLLVTCSSYSVFLTRNELAIFHTVAVNSIFVPIDWCTVTWCRHMSDKGQFYMLCRIAVINILNTKDTHILHTNHKKPQKPTKTRKSLQKTAKDRKRP